MKTKQRVSRVVHGRRVHKTITVSKKVAGPLPMPTTIVGQNGVVEQVTTGIAVSGCPRAKAVAHKPRAKGKTKAKAKRRAG